jgi:hypothetical protein
MYCLSTLPPRLYQANPFSRGQGESETGTVIHQLTSKEVAPTLDELQAIEEEEEDEQALTRAIDTFIATTRVGRVAKASNKVISNRQQAMEEAKGGRGGCGGCGSRGGRGGRTGHA